MAADLVPFLFVLGVLGVMAVAVLVTKAAKSQGDAMTALAADLGVPVLGGDPYTRIRCLSWIRRPTRIDAAYGLRQLKVFHFSRGHGRNRTQYAAIHVPVANPHGLTLHITAEGYLSKIGRALGMQDIHVGDPAFDKGFIIKSKQPDFARAILLPEVRTQLLKAWDEHAAKGWIKLDGGTLLYEEIGTLRNAVGRRRFAVLAPLCCQMAEIIEIYSEAVPAPGG